MADPMFIKAVRTMLAAQARATAAGVTLAPEDLHAFIDEETKGKYGLGDARKLIGSIDTGVTPRNLARSATQGALMNWGDELLRILPQKMGGGEAGEQEMRLRGELFHQAHPKTDIAAGMAGGIAPWLLAPEAKGLSLAASVARGARVGLLAGAANGAGAGEDAMGRVKGAGVGAVVGTAIGALTPAFIGGIKEAYNPTARALARVDHAIKQSGGVGALRGKVASMAASGRGDDMMLADVSDHMRAATDMAVNNSDDVMIPMAQKFKARRADQSDRLLSDVESALGEQPDAGARQSSLEASRRSWAAGPDGYQGLRDANPTVAGDLGSVLQQPRVSKALTDAHEAGLIGRNPVATKGPLSFEKIQSVKEDLDDAVNVAFRGGKNNLGSRLAEARDMVVEHLQSNVPGYESIAKEYAKRKGLETALQAGQEAWGQVDTRGLARQVGSMAGGELDQFRYGMASKLVEKLRSAATNHDEATKVMNGSKALQDKLAAVFGDQQTFRTFMQRVSAEGELSRLQGVFGNSATARRLQSAGFDPRELGVDAAAGALHGPHGLMLATAHGLLKATTGRLTRATAREMGPMLQTQGAPNIDALLASLAQRSPLLGKVANTLLPAAGGRASASLFDF